MYKADSFSGPIISGIIWTVKSNFSTLIGIVVGSKR